MSEMINAAAEVVETVAEAAETSTFFTEEAVEFLTAPMNPKTKILLLAAGGVLLVGAGVYIVKRKDIKKKFEERSARKRAAETPVEVVFTVEEDSEIECDAEVKAK